jgi:hypothetical protein
VLPALSTSSSAFQAILDDLVRTVGEAEAAAEAGPVEQSQSDPEWAAEPMRGPLDVRFTADERLAGGAGGGDAAEAAHVGAPPGLLRGRGDLTLVIGLGSDAVAAARIIAEAIGDAEVRPGGCSRAAAPRVDDRRGALRARADGVRRERPMVAAYGIVRGAADVPGLTESLAGIEPDQVWVAVDASRKSEDTAAWVRAVDAILAVDGLAVTGSALTATPDTVRALRIPIGWLDGTRVGIG